MSLYLDANHGARANTEFARKPREMTSIRKNVEEWILNSLRPAPDRAGRCYPVAYRIEMGAGIVRISYSAAPGNTASILVFNVAALKGLTM